MLTSYIKRRLLKQSAAVNPHASEFEVNNWVLSEFVIQKLIPVVGVHPYPINELCLMAAAICGLKPTHIFEWGTNLGKSARIFYETACQFGISADIYSIDLPDDINHVEHPRGQRGKFVKNLKGVTLLLGDGFDTALNHYMSLEQKDDILPFFFIDGDHSYESVHRELEGIITLVPKASILLHDTFYQSPDSDYNVGPFRAIEDVLDKRAGEYKMLTQNLGLPGMTLLYRK